MAAEDPVAALAKRLDNMEKKQKKQRKELEQAHARIDFLTRIITQSYPFQTTAPVVKLRDVGPDEVPFLCNYLVTARQYTTVDGSYAELTEAQFSAVADMFKDAKQIEELDLSRNRIGEYTKVLVKLFANGSSLKMLLLPFTSLTDASLLGSIGTLQAHGSLTSLSLAGNHLTAASMSELAKVIASMPHLKTLNLSRNPLTPAGVKELAVGLRNSATLSKLALQEVGADDASMKDIAGLLKEGRSSLTTLTLSNNKLTSAGIKNLVEDVRKVTHLILVGNEFGDAGAKLLAELISGKNALIELDIRHCQITAEGAKSIAGAVSSNTSIQTIGIHGNEIGKDGQETISAAFKGRTQKGDVDDDKLKDGRRGTLMRLISSRFLSRETDEEDDAPTSPHAKK